MELKYRTAPAALDGESEGRLKAAFSVFDELDHDGDVVKASAFTDGQAVPIVWAHDWQKPIGRGVVRVEGKHAVVDGGLFLGTTAGRDAYETIKAMADLQQWSFGFRVTGSEKGQHGGKPARLITKAEVFEVSPVLVGANQNTRTLALKGQERIEDEAERVRADLEEYLEREASLADLRAKEGRPISTARRQRLERMLAAFEEHTSELRALLDETNPPEKGASPDSLLAQFLAAEARLAGVQV